MIFITLSGVDGSGKSTQLKLLKDHFEREGKKVAYFHAVEFSLANRLARLFNGEKDFVPGKEKAVTSASWWSIHLRQKFLLWDMLRFRVLKRKLARQGYGYLLSDRSFYDSIINIGYLKRAPKPPKFFDWLLPRADYPFYLDVEGGEVMNRERFPEQGLGYLEAKGALFQTKMLDWNMHLIEAGKPPEAVFEEIKEKLSLP